MFILRTLFIVLFLTTSTHSDTIQYLLKIPNLEIYILDSKNDIKYLIPLKPFKVGINDNSVECEIPSKKLINQKSNLIKKNFKIYKKEFLNKINLKFIILCKDMKVANIPVLGIPNHPLKVILLNINTKDYYLSRTIHHEIFHIINEQYLEEFKYDEWKTFNKKSFSYYNCSPCTKISLELIKKTNGFLSEYSQRNEAEDMAETFSFLMLKNNNLINIINQDKILVNKVNYIKKKILKIDNSFSLINDKKNKTN